ncbi:PREDICTED: F-box protein At5g52880 [Nicotiana attenuata]|uniref:F-box protein n=1 Tax=Nicotiana attenuata TaxID=49451 RepID=A0A314LBX4_NICAT|nr:PREDICTED: F-box protein At5g52880 [Nicotiana attenuata]OIT39261.1 f-box protein [Nicotiana attenuata]
MGGLMVERYEKLGLKESLSRAYHYPIACEELSCILRNAYSKIPKNLQSLIFQDSLAAFRLLPQMQTQAAISAANGLLHSIEAALPKQKKVLAASEFKQAMVAQRRRRKVQPMVEGRSQLPQDILVHIFGFLDLTSLVTASLVCRSWSVAASDNHLWQSMHISFFGRPSDNPNIIRLTYGVERITFTPGNTTTASVDWRDAFKRAYRGISRKVTSQRGFCKQCNSIVWLSNSKCSNECFGKISDEHQIMPVSIKQIVDYVIEESIPSSDSDSDTDDSVDGSLFKLWAYPMRFGEPHARCGSI